MDLRRSLSGFCLIAGAAGCALLPPPDPAEVRKDAMPNVALPGKWTAQGAANGAVEIAGGGK